MRAKYYVNLKTGVKMYVCGRHVTKVAYLLDDAGRMALKRGVRSIGSLHAYTPKQCEHCEPETTTPQQNR